MRRILTALAGVLGLAQAGAAQSYLSPENFAEVAETGGIYTCASEDADLAVAFKIGRIEALEALGQVYHLQVIVLEPAGMPRLGHIPVGPESFVRCREDAAIAARLPEPFDDAAIDEGYNIWRAENGGVFTISIIEAVELILSNIK